MSGEISLAFAPRVHSIDSSVQSDDNASLSAKQTQQPRGDKSILSVPFRFQPMSNQDELIVAKANVLGRSLPSYAKPPRPSGGKSAEVPEDVPPGLRGPRRFGAVVSARDLTVAVQSVSRSHEAIEMQQIPARGESASGSGLGSTLESAEADPPVVVMHLPRAVPAIQNVVSQPEAVPSAVAAQSVAPGHRRKPSRIQAAQIEMSRNLVAESRLGLQKTGLGKKLWTAISPVLTSVGHTLVLAARVMPKSIKSAFTGGSEYTCGMIDFVHQPMMNRGADHDVLKRRATAEKAIFRASGTAMWVCSALSVIPVVGLGFLAAAATLALTRALWTGYRTHQVRAEVLKAQKAAPSSGPAQAKINTTPIVKKGAIDVAANAAAPLGAVLTSVGALFGPVGIIAAIVVPMVTGLLSTLHKDVSILAQAEAAKAASRRA